MKKLARQTLDTYAVVELTPKALKNILAARGYTVIRYSALTPSEETARLMAFLGVTEAASHNDALIYADRERRIIFIRKDISEEEFLYLLALSLGRVLTVTKHDGALLRGTPEEEARAAEFAYHLTDLNRHTLLYNFFKYHPVSGMVSMTVGTFVVVTAVCAALVITHFGGDLPLYKDGGSASLDNGTLTAPVVQTAQTPPSQPSGTDDGKDDAAVLSAATHDGDSTQNTVQKSETQDDTGAAVSIPPQTDNGSVSNVPDHAVGSADFVIPEAERVYYATANGTKYHLAGCSYLNGKEPVTLTAEAIAVGGYTPCSRCFK